MNRPSAVRAWIQDHDFLPSKVLGQNFLIDDNILTIMVEAAAPASEDRILEVGPGLGMLTEPLLERTGGVVAIEKDHRLAEHLREHLADRSGFTLIEADALTVPLDTLCREHRLNKMVANLPYSVGSRILVTCFQQAEGFERLVVTVQREVGERLAAAPDTPDYGLLAIWAQMDYEVRVVKLVSPSCFMPRPQVTSAIVRMVRSGNRRAGLRHAGRFDALIKAAFSRRRKQMGTILQAVRFPGQTVEGRTALAAAGIDPARRPETLAVEEWIALADGL
ncbi:MAG TPA: 16S rRNA (adenine(1518)-N(6)/adenine(1519)-N(6))-dimethyltransferase RsmA [Kiritimatiellia bacterium]|nr:16S rRNA (adenine(1518)-N(6)/adenine(1519)-N(6))-dimethyltransferase RsmA [Kiritimatiellia bacterium]HMP95771.1 16S rRNA (adenine(1518)-N(6)/adenine(1519)-N(6))-dimethyltransferase RsmA [Kiritimatiellia bacterium]